MKTQPALYFLRSSESKIVYNMMQYAHPESENLQHFYEFYGLKTTDLGLYALVENQIAGAIWCREIQGVQQISIAILPSFTESDLAEFMLTQFLQEAAVVYDSLEIECYTNTTIKALFEGFGFEAKEQSSKLFKILEKKELIRPSDGYDPRRWMD